MVIAYIIFFLSILTWLLVPFRQFKSKYFIFFLILAFLDPLVMISHLLFPVDPFRIYTIFIFLNALSLLNFNWIKKNLLFIIPIFILDILLAVYFRIPDLTIVLILLHLIILIIILRVAVVDLYKKNLINMFNFILCIYEISIIMKFMIVLTDAKTGATFFFLTSAFEILIGFYFILYNGKNSPKIKLNMSVQKN